MVRSNTLTHHLNNEQCRQICWATVRWCKEKFGTNNRKKYALNLYVEVANESGDACGEYNYPTNHIFIYTAFNKTVKDLVSTTIHEYIHSLQPVATKYFSLLKKHKYYSHHPLERQAFYYEKKYASICWKEIKSSIF